MSTQENEQQQIEAEERPEWLQEKFKTPEDQARAYADA